MLQLQKRETTGMGMRPDTALAVPCNGVKAFGHGLSGTLYDL
jgi:hypothetical protein